MKPKQDKVNQIPACTTSIDWYSADEYKPKVYGIKDAWIQVLVYTDNGHIYPAGYNRLQDNYWLGHKILNYVKYFAYCPEPPKEEAEADISNMYGNEHCGHCKHYHNGICKVFDIEGKNIYSNACYLFERQNEIHKL